MNKKLALIASVIIISILIAGTVFAATRASSKGTQTAAAEEQGIGGKILDSVVCLFTCGWPAWVLLLLPPIAVWFYTRFIHVFG